MTQQITQTPLPLSVERDHNIALKDRWNFYLDFEFPADLQGCEKPLELMVAGVDPGAETLSVLPSQESGLQHRTNRIIIWLYDDLKGEMMRAIRKLQLAQPVFNMRLSMCGNSGSELEAYVYQGCTLEALQHSMLSFERTEETIKLKGTTSKQDVSYTLQGTVSNNNQKAVSMKLLQVNFVKVEHEFISTIKA